MSSNFLSPLTNVCLHSPPVIRTWPQKTLLLLSSVPRSTSHPSQISQWISCRSLTTISDLRGLSWLACDHRTSILSYDISFIFFTKGFGENFAIQLISLQNANGSWELDEDLSKILGTSLEDIKAANPAKVRYKVVSVCVCFMMVG